jgi:glycosyltransferase involved in cell wall biosynthesis
VQGVLVDNEYEIIIVDDLSTDNTKKIIDSIIWNDNAVKLVCHDKNLGKGASITFGIQ